MMKFKAANWREQLAELAQRAQRATSSTPDEVRQALELAEKRAKRQLVLERQPLPITNAMHTAIIRDELERTVALEAVLLWLDRTRQRRPTLVLYGASGAGKSVAAAAALARLGAGSWCSPRDLLAASRSSYGEAAVRWHEYQHASLLVLDDIGGELEGARPYVADALLGLLAYRPRLLTIMTTRFARGHLRARYDSDPLTRLLDDCADHITIPAVATKLMLSPKGTRRDL